MAGSNIADEFPLVEGDDLEPDAAPPTPPEDQQEPEEQEDAEPQSGRFSAAWEMLSRSGLAEHAVRLGTSALAIVLVLAVVFGMRGILQTTAPAEASPAEAVQTSPEPTEVTVEEPVKLPTLDLDAVPEDTFVRTASLHTTIPTRPRVDVITYTVQQGDTLFGIADTFGLQPETILWGNNDELQDNPHLLSPDQVLNILPTNGTYHLWREGEDFNKVADFYNVDPQKIIEYPGNHFDLTSFNTEAPPIEPGSWLIVPEGSRPLKDWGPPAITRTDPARARYYGEGFCGSIYEGAIGNGTFVWPTTSRQISGYGFSGIHPAIDIGGSLGNAIFATDSGVIVYSGWSNYGYGFLVVVDHGNGWQSAYAHLSSINAVCGQSVFQGTVIGGLGSTGNSSGPHLHCELLFNGGKVNPLNFLQ